MKKLLLLIFSLIFFSSFAQLDREHWFAPMYDGQSNQDPEQYLHLSTNETTPFIAKVYSNNAVVYQVTISKGNPAIIDIARTYIITSSTSDLHRVVNKGLYVKADKPCFANLRFKVVNHAEIITSKGTAGIGQNFYTVVAPNVQNNDNLGFSASFLATENNTTVTVGNFKKNLNFNNYGAANSFTFTLNKGESYIIDGRSTSAANFNGFIGATVTADKPISMSNGNFNGQYATSDTGKGSDILMDQSVPVDKLGNEFVIVKGYGAINNNMEGAIVVATENNTALYLNDSTVPFSTLINKGDYYLVNESNYILRGNDHYNLHIKSDKNVYVYQLLGGVESGTSPLATGGMNYIPPLNCYLPKKIDELSYISKISPYDSDYTFLTKLNIITEKGAVVKVNGIVPNAQYGPYDISTISANQSWVTYSIPGVTGNITVESTKAVTAGIASGNNAFGYGGYFAGFSAIPLILKTDGDCLPGVKLAVTEGFDSYEWLEKIGAVYVPAPGINNTFEYTPTKAGIYAVKVKQGSCPEIQTKDYKFYNCTTYTNYDYITCSEVTIIPAFILSTQNVNIGSIAIDTPPTKGNVVINANGTITYTANLNATGTDTFKYSFSGNGTLPDSEVAQATITLNQIVHYDKVLNECTLTGIATYDLSSAEVSPDTTVSKVYYETLNGAENQIAGEVINNFTNLTTADRFVWVRMVNTYGCITISKIELKSKLPADVKPELYTKTHCDEDVDGVLDGIYKVELNLITPSVLLTPADHIVRYYDTEIKANAGLLTDNIAGIFSFPSNTSIWIRVEPKNGCPIIIKEITLTTGIKLAVSSPINKNVCDNNIDNTENIDLAGYVSFFITNPYDSVKYFDDFTKAQNNLPGQNISPTQTITGNKTFYYRFSKAGVCDALGTLNITFKATTPSTTLPATVTVCEGTATSLNVGTGYSSILWSTGSTSNTINVGVGNYFVDLTNSSGCVYRQNVSVVESPKPLWNIAAFNRTYCDDDFDGIIKVKFSTITPTIISNSSIFKVEYSLLSDFSTLLPDDWTYTANTTVHVRTISAFCPEEKKTIDFRIGDKLTLIKNVHTASECDDDFDGIKTVNLANYKSNFTTETGVTATYFKTLADAQKNTGSVPNEVNISNSGTYYLRFQNAGVCDNIGTLTITIKVPKKSAVLVDKNICPEATTTLDAGPGFSKYLWSNGSTVQSITVPVGDYWVELTVDGCTYRQQVSVKGVPLPVIAGVEIQGGTVTILVTSGNPPYQYSLNGSTYQRSNVFNDIQPENYTVFVISADECIPTTTEINILRILNVITPNDDGKNDVLTYADLLRKDNPFLQIFDRYGVSVFKGDKNNSFSWDGKISGKAVATGSYWYVLQWQEPGSATVSKMTGWILVKSRE